MRQTVDRVLKMHTTTDQTKHKALSQYFTKNIMMTLSTPGIKSTDDIWQTAYIAFLSKNIITLKRGGSVMVCCCSAAYRLA